jgi:hypothetical protein
MSTDPTFIPMPRGQRERYRTAAQCYVVSSAVPDSVELCSISWSQTTTLVFSPGQARAVAAELMAAAAAADAASTAACTDGAPVAHGVSHA